MTALERLNRVRVLHFEHRRLLMKVEELETLATRMVPSLSKTPEVHSGSKTREDTWALLMDYKAEYEDRICQFCKACRELESEIDSCISNPRIRAAMKCKFVDCMTKRQMSEAMHYSERQLTRYLKTGETLYCSAFKEGEEDERN